MSRRYFFARGNVWAGWVASRRYFLALSRRNPWHAQVVRARVLLRARVSHVAWLDRQ